MPGKISRIAARLKGASADRRTGDRGLHFVTYWWLDLGTATPQSAWLLMRTRRFWASWTRRSSAARPPSRPSPSVQMPRGGKSHPRCSSERSTLSSRCTFLRSTRGRGKTRPPMPRTGRWVPANAFDTVRESRLLEIPAARPARPTTAPPQRAPPDHTGRPCRAPTARTASATSPRGWVASISTVADIPVTSTVVTAEA